MRFAAVALLLMIACPVRAQVVKLYAGVNTVSFDGSASLPSDYEVGGNGRASLSPHISFVGSVYTGLARNYIREAGGVRITATDVDNPDFSVGFGMQYQGSNDQSIRPNEWAPDVSVGWRPWNKLPKVLLGAQGSYGLDSNQACLMLGVRYELAGF